MKFNPRPEDKSVYVAGVHVGYVTSTLPWLNPKYWMGLGMQLDNLPTAAEFNLELKKEKDILKEAKI